MLDSITIRLEQTGLRSVPLTRRFVYSYVDDREKNDGDLGWLVMGDRLELAGLDEDMQVGLEHFSLTELREIETCIDWSRGSVDERTLE